MIELVIFDLDGVLVDACDWHRVALNEALKQTCKYEISLRDHYNVFNGIPTRVKLEKLMSWEVVPASMIEEVYQLKQEKTIEVIKQKAEPRPEKIALIESLQERGMTVACFTNSIRETALLMLQKTGVYDLMEMVVTNQDVEQPKPHPEGYLKVLKHFNVDPKSAIIVEDSPKGLEAAHASGCHVMQVENPNDVTVEKFKEYLDENFDSHGR